MTNEEKMAMFLDTLTDEQKQSLRLALNQPTEAPVKKTRKQTRGKKPVIKVEETKPNKKRRVQKIKMDEDDGDVREDDDEILNEEGPARTRTRRKRKVPGKPGTNQKPCRTEPVRLGKKIPDFAKDPDFNRFRRLTRKDEEFWEGKRPKASPRTRVGYVEVKCIKCKQTYEVSAKLGHKRFVCDDCITRE